MARREELSVEQGYTHTAFAPQLPPVTSRRRPRVRHTIVARTCEFCGRTGIDVVAPFNGRGPRCFSGITCKAEVSR